MNRHLRVDITGSDKKRLDPSCSIFVGNLPYDIEDESVWQHFSECGTVEGVRIIRDAQFRIGKGFGYVLFDSPLAVTRALKMNDVKLQGRKLRVTKAVKKVKQNKQTGNKEKQIGRFKNKKNGAPKHQNIQKEKKKKNQTSTTKSFEGKRAIEGKSPRLTLPEWKQREKNISAYNRRKLKQKKKK